MSRRSNRRRKQIQIAAAAIDVLESRQLLTAVTAILDDFWAEPLPSEVAAGQQASFYNLLGGDRGAIFNPGSGKVEFLKGAVRAEVLQSGSFAGIFQSVNHPISESIPLNFHKPLSEWITDDVQPTVRKIKIQLNDGLGRFKVELKTPSNTILWADSAILTGGNQELTFSLPTSGLSNVQSLVLIVDGTANNFFEASSISLELDSPDLGQKEAFVWTYANLLHNYDHEIGMVRDRANFPSGSFDNVSATGSFALATALAYTEGLVTKENATSIIEKVTDRVLALPTYKGVLPHFTRGRFSPEIVPGTEWASIDSVLTYTPLLQSRQIMELPTQAVENAISAMDWDALTLDNGTISHGFKENGELIPSGWDFFGGETWLAVWAAGAARPNSPLPNVTEPHPPTWNGSQFIDEIFHLYLPLDKDIWGNDWNAYRAEQAAKHFQYFEDKGLPICCLNAAEVAEPWTVAEGQIYQAFGIGGAIAANDGTALTGHVHAAPSALGMLASLEPIKVQQHWETLKSFGAVSPLNVVETIILVDQNGEQVPIVNPLKSSWNLVIAALGYARGLSGEDAYPAYQAANANSFVSAGLSRLNDSVTPAEGYFADFNTGGFDDYGIDIAGGSSADIVSSLGTFTSDGNFAIVDTNNATFDTTQYGGTAGSSFTTPAFIAPANGAFSASIGFGTNEATPTSTYNDFYSVLLLTDNGTVTLASGDTYDEGFTAANGSGYKEFTGFKQIQADLSAYAGQTIQIQILVSDKQDTAFDSILAIDDIEVASGTITPPTATGYFADFNTGEFGDFGIDVASGSSAEIVSSLGTFTSDGNFAVIDTNNATYDTTQYGGTAGSSFTTPTFIAPANAVFSANIGFGTNEATPSVAYNDFYSVLLLTDSGTVTLASGDTYDEGFTDANGSGYKEFTGFKQVQADLSVYAGQTIQIQILVSDKQDTAFDSILAIDDLEVASGTITPPTTTGYFADFNSGGFDAFGIDVASGSSADIVDSLGTFTSDGNFAVIDTNTATYNTTQYGGTAGSSFTTPTFIVPVNAVFSASIGFGTNEATPATTYNDFYSILLLTDSGTVTLASGDTYDEGFTAANGSGYKEFTGFKQVQADLSAYAGQTIQIQILVSDKQDTVFDSVLAIDDLFVNEVESLLAAF